MAHARPLRSVVPPTTTEHQEPSPRHDNDGWADTFLIAGLVVALSLLVFLLTS